MRYFIILLLFCLVSCGEVTTHTNSPTPSGSPLPQDLAIVLGANFTDPTGTLSLLPINAPRTASKNVQITHSDAVVRVFGDLIYVVNRLGGDNIQVVDPDQDYDVLSQFSVGQGTNPQDLIALSPTKSYVTLYQPEDNRSDTLSVDDLILINPQTGDIFKKIDLTPFTTNDGDRFARASDMILVKGKILVAVQDLPGDLSKSPDQSGKIVAINTTTDTTTGSVTLSCRDPIAMAYSAVTDLLYVACADYFNLSSPHAGIEVVDPDTLESVGLFITDNVLGGAPGDIEVIGDQGFVTVGYENAGKTIFATKVVSFNLDLTADPDVTTIYDGKAYIQDIAASPNNLLVIGDRDPKVNGIIFFDPASNDVIDGPINTGPLPSSIDFLNR